MFYVAFIYLSHNVLLEIISIIFYPKLSLKIVYFIVGSCRIYICNLFSGPQGHQCLRTTVKCFTLFK